MKPLSILAGAAAALALAQPGLARDKHDVHAEKTGTQVIVSAGERPILKYQAEPGELPRKDIKPIFKRGGYIQAIYTPSGKLVTDDFPPNHVHHHGVWSPWTSTEFEGRKPDFWNMGDGKGRVDFVKLVGDVWSKNATAGFKAEHRFIDMLAKPEKVALLETWEVTATTDGKRNVIDLTITQTCATDSPLKLPEYHYGGLGFRGNRAWDGAGNAKFLTASGITDRLKVNTAKEPWCWVGGQVDGQPCGIAILCHPSNFRAPQPIRVHPTEPFFCYAPQQAGAMSIEPGQPYVMRYRLIVADGGPDAAALQAAADEYAKVK
ncbi:PmoA family protein [Luteolibacter flavescens]|uniref:PmoA family protein n=1 Tax=Luteolibacter flavescens TaxID=1859460 RepID=A0ABT3FW41_9BACT|nr:PmoA family protein [Luteolibacter flavescens]MCW1887801.1 PmoA family protein [Luteolibacter flavescens]